MKLDVHVDGDLSAAFEAEIVAAEKAVTVGVTRTGEALKAAWRTQVTSAGLGRRLANAICGLDQLLGEGKAQEEGDDSGGVALDLVGPLAEATRPSRSVVAL